VTALPVSLDLDRPARHPGFASGARVWLFRHGEVHEDWQGKAYGGEDVPLSGTGERDTHAVAAAFATLRPELVLSSTLRRARLLGEALAASTGAPLELDAGLVEIARGRWQGLAVADLWRDHAADVAAFYADPWGWGAHGGETDRDVLARAWPAFERAVRRAAGGTLFVAAHYNVIRVLVARALGVAPEHSFRLRVDLSAICRLRDGPEGWVLERANVRAPDGHAP
jgi:broad specificity phosphatase PhoE